jgi:peptide/nickel transport system substrate-binding protein
VKRAALLGLALALAACAGAAEEAQSPAAEPAPSAEQTPSSAAEVEPPRGGTLRVGLVDWDEHEEQSRSPDGKAYYALDPQWEYYPTSLELFRCCLVRTLLSYSGQPTDEGGAELRPDLAAGMPEVSADGLTWTFRLKQGLHYAPPYEDTEIVAGDVVRAIERTFAPVNASVAELYGGGRVPLGAYYFYYSPLILGAEAFAEGTASSISGLETPDDHTLVVHLTEQAGDLGARFALPATAPIPPGAAEGHDDGYGAFLVASGPYMLEEYTEGEPIVMTRNPSWDPATDQLREAYVDRIELMPRLDQDSAYAMVDRGDLDLVLDSKAPDELAARYQGDPALADRLVTVPLDWIRYAALVLAAPPFDDVHVRRAVNLVVDKAQLVELAGGPLAARIATHIAPDSLEANLLLDYDPYPTDVEAAKAEMARSTYDRDGDGLCDDPACATALALALIEQRSHEEMTAAIADDLAKIGLTFELEQLPAEELFEKLAARDEQVAFVFNVAWAKDFPSAAGWFPPLFGGANPPDTNPSLLGMSPERLEEWGYPTTSVPSIDEELAECQPLVGGEQTKCWAGIDQILMEQVVPWVPYLEQLETRIVSDRVISISVDQAVGQPALDGIALDPEQP